MKADIYQRITDQIVFELEKGVRPWLKPWNAEHAAGRITISAPIRKRRLSIVSAGAPAGSANRNIGDLNQRDSERIGIEARHQPSGRCVVHPGADIGDAGCNPDHREGPMAKRDPGDARCTADELLFVVRNGHIFLISYSDCANAGHRIAVAWCQTNCSPYMSACYPPAGQRHNKCRGETS
jgi:hypothetical protein